jgi:hypothetical protein
MRIGNVIVPKYDCDVCGEPAVSRIIVERPGVEGRIRRYIRFTHYHKGTRVKVKNTYCYIREEDLIGRSFSQIVRHAMNHPLEELPPDPQPPGPQNSEIPGKTV